MASTVAWPAPGKACRSRSTSTLLVPKGGGAVVSRAARMWIWGQGAVVFLLLGLGLGLVVLLVLLLLVLLVLLLPVLLLLVVLSVLLLGMAVVIPVCEVACWVEEEGRVLMGMARARRRTRATTRATV